MLDSAVGKATKTKRRNDEAQEVAFLTRFAQLSIQAKTPPMKRPLVEELTAYSGSFVRDPAAFVLKTRSSDRCRQIMDLVRHVFGAYRVPRILEQCWEAYLDAPRPAVAGESSPPVRTFAQRRLNPNLMNTDFRLWYIAVATGHSLYKTHAKALLTKRETHLFLTCSHALTLPQALVYAVARAQGLQEGLSLRVARSKLTEQRLDAFWLDAVRFFAQPGQTPAQVNGINDLIDFLAFKRGEDPSFRIFGSDHSLAALERRKEEWHRTLQRTKILGNAQWEGCGLPDHTFERREEGQDVQWVFRQITTAKDLGAEGTAMRHCVLGYRSKCVSGACSIWSLARRDAAGTAVRKVTIELTNDGRIVQARRFANVAPRNEEKHLIELWARMFGLQSGNWR